jgi:hypothetical protein
MSVCKAVRVGQRPRGKPLDEPLYARMRDIANTRAIGETAYVDWSINSAKLFRHSLPL